MYNFALVRANYRCDYFKKKILFSVAGEKKVWASQILARKF
jgi:hypothetical protein